MALQAKRKWVEVLRISVILRIALATLVCFAFLSLFSIQVRYAAAVAGLLPTLQADAYSWEGEKPRAVIGSSGTITTHYCSEVVAMNDATNREGLPSTVLTWDDSWFAGDPHTYNHGIATASAILSAVTNSESQFYGSVEGAIPYAEQTLGRLGFENIQTESYALRSSTYDQIGALFAGSHDVAAYTLAIKTLTGANGTPQETLVFVGIRGSYGIEWLSNLKFFETMEDTTDHYGFKAAEQEIREALLSYLEQAGIDIKQAKFLIAGHSRGGSIANLLAADLLGQENSSSSLATSDNVYAYTFGAPHATLSDDRCDRRYTGIFNIVNPTDIVPQLPLAAWGYDNYGVTVSLPHVKDAQYISSSAAMQEAFTANTGYPHTSTIDELEALDSFGATAGTQFPSMDDLFTPAGMVTAGQILMGVDVERALMSHYPDTYIAWLQSIDSQALSFS